MTEDKPSPEHQAFVEGYDAFLNDRPKEDAPKESPTREAWIAGWEKAEQDAAEAYNPGSWPTELL